MSGLLFPNHVWDSPSLRNITNDNWGVIPHLKFHTKQEFSNNAEKIINEFNLITINTDNNIKLLEIISKTHEFIDNEDWMYLYLALIEIGKKNIKLAKKYLNLSENVTNNPNIIKKIIRIRKRIE